jgi:proton-dependent oligopeptide transporter, POT family
MSPAAADPAASAPPGKMPRQIPFIIGNEGCERFSFYGMRNILTVFLAFTFFQHLPVEADRQAAAKEIFHTFVIGVYFFPLLGGWLSDRFFGKYNTIFWVSLIYCAGHACLAIFEDNRLGFYTGLGLIALGSGGIKPLISAFVGDQFDKSNKHLSKKVYDAFYWIINFGSFFASLIIPILLRDHGPSVAFGVPGVLMLTATVVFWAGRHRYVMVPPAPPNPHSFVRVARTALLSTAPGQGRPGLALAGLGLAVVCSAPFLFFTTALGFVELFCLSLVAILAFGGAGTWIQLDRARGVHPEEAVDGVRSVLRILVVFALVTPFWSLFDQKASTWVLTAKDMIKPEWFSPAQMQALNPALVMIIIPFNNLVLYPALRRRGIELSALKRMSIGLFFAAASWVVIGAIQLVMDGGTALSITWQILPYALLTFGEVLVSATGLEFAYSQAPPSMKGVIMSFWNLAVTIGNLWVLLANTSVRSPSVTKMIESTGLSQTAFLMFFFAGFAFLAAIAFSLYARRYKMVDHYRESSPAPATPTAAVPGARVIKDGDKK